MIPKEDTFASVWIGSTLGKGVVSCIRGDAPKVEDVIIASASAKFESVDRQHTGGSE